MRAAVITQFGPPEAMTIREVPVPAPAAGQVLVQVHAAGMNLSMHRTGPTELGPRSHCLRCSVAFYPGRLDAAWLDDERVQAQPGDVYGGWITDRAPGDRPDRARVRAR
jgi:hypothetical protein